MLDYGQLILSLMMVIGFIIILAIIMQRIGPHRITQQGAIRILISTAVGARERIALIQAGDQYLLVGMTSHNIQTLQTLSKVEAQAMLDHAPHKAKTHWAARLLGTVS